MSDKNSEKLRVSPLLQDEVSQNVRRSVQRVSGQPENFEAVEAMRGRVIELAKAMFEEHGPCTRVLFNGPSAYYKLERECEGREEIRSLGLFTRNHEMPWVEITPPILIGRGASLEDSDGPLSLDEFDKILGDYHIKTDYEPILPEDQDKLLHSLKEFPKIKFADIENVLSKLSEMVEIIESLNALEASDKLGSDFEFRPEVINNIIKFLEEMRNFENLRYIAGSEDEEGKNRIRVALEKIGNLEVESRLGKYVRPYAVD